MTVSFLLMAFSKKWWTVNLRYFILFNFEVFLLCTSTFLCTQFRSASITTANTYILVPSDIVINRLLLSIKMCPGVITISVVYCICNALRIVVMRTSSLSAHIQGHALKSAFMSQSSSAALAVVNAIYGLSIL
jgi:hypothetical protein